MRGCLVLAMVAIAIAGRAKRMSWKSPLQRTLPKLATAYGYRPQKSQAKTRESMSTMLIDSARCCAGDAFGTEFTDRRETGRWVARNASGLVSQWLGFFFWRDSSRRTGGFTLHIGQQSS